MTHTDEFIDANQSLLKRLFEKIDVSREAIIGRVRLIAETPSPTFEEAGRTEYLLTTFPEMGLADVHSLPRGSVIGFTQGMRAPVKLLLAAHIDTVFPMETDLKTRIDGGVLRGPGTGDNAANVAAVITLAGLLRDLGIEPAGNIAFCGTVREEGLGNLGGMEEVLDEIGDMAAAAIAVDGLTPAITNRSLAIKRYAVTVRGPGGHAWSHFGTPSAIHEMARIVSALASFDVPADPKTTFNVGKIQGGRSINAIAQECTIEVDLRSLEQESVEDLERKFLQLLTDIPSADIAAETKLIGEKPGVSIDPEDALVTTSTAAGRHLGLEPVLNAASTDATLALSRGIRAVSFGTYTGGGTHTIEEHVDLDSLAIGLKWLALTVLALTGVRA